ncbi:hypothetical protein DY000_02004670 [Brassica cretica]|uniref:Uncharacterized protein n=1 Tax=Brassica cretica TaxID=69181 RepID=A0ABQ7C826_BRACR|nr:hypothetical protein DY000_02004670 [Brassica cretica]
MHGDETTVCLIDPRDTSVADPFVKIQASPTSFEVWFQEASVLQKISEGSRPADLGADPLISGSPDCVAYPRQGVASESIRWGGVRGQIYASCFPRTLGHSFRTCSFNSGMSFTTRFVFHSLVSRVNKSETMRSLSRRKTGPIGLRFVSGWIQESVQTDVDSPFPIALKSPSKGPILPRLV